MSQPTHFIQQINYRAGILTKQREYFSGILPISELDYWLKDTQRYIGIHTVAVFKIKLKQP